MKKLFMFLAVAGLATFGASCSKSDDSPAPVEAKELKLSANPNGTVDMGTEITFSVYSGTEKINDANIKADGVVVTNGKWKADKAGTFKFKATKKDYKDSNEVIIIVKDAPILPEKDFLFVGNKVYDMTYAILGANMYVDGKDADGKDKYSIAIYTASNDAKDKFAVYTFQSFKGTSFSDYKAAWTKGNAVQGIQIAIIQTTGQPLKTPYNTAPKDWILLDAYSVVDGDNEYSTISEATELSWGFASSGKDDGKGTFLLNLDGDYEDPASKVTTIIEAPTEGLLRFEVPKPTTGARALKATKILKASN